MPTWNSVFQEMRQELNKTANNEIYKCNLTSQSVTKDKLIHWLETVCFLVEECQAVYSCFVGGAESPRKTALTIVIEKEIRATQDSCYEVYKSCAF